MKKKLLLIGLSALMIFALTSCGGGKPKVCKSTICVEGNCTEIEVPCEDSAPVEDNTNNDTNVTDDNSGDIAPVATPEPTPSVKDLPTLVEDPGFDYSGLLDVEQAAVNAFQAIVDGDYEGLYNMLYMEDSKWITIQDIATYFQISNYGSIKGKNIEIVGAKASNQGYNRTVNIQYRIGAEEDYRDWSISMRLFNDVWKYIDEGFIGEDWTFRVSSGAVVKLDGQKLTATQQNTSNDAYRIDIISKVEHKLEATLNGKTETKYIVPFSQSADIYFED